MVARSYGAAGGIPRRSGRISNHCLDQVLEQRQAGSLTGAVASQRVTEAFKGSLRLVGHQPQSASA